MVDDILDGLFDEFEFVAGPLFCSVGRQFGFDDDDDFSCDVARHLQSVPPNCYRPEHLEGMDLNERTFHYVIQGMREIILKYDLTEAGAAYAQERLAGDVVEKFTIGVEYNFMGNPYFKLRWDGVDMYGKIV